MSLVTLSIKEFGITEEGWTSSHGPIKKDDLKDIVEQRTDSSTALNALPTPFARFYVFDEAFRRLLMEKNNPENLAGDAYHALASKCLDVFELMFNLKRHRSEWEVDKNDRINLHIRTWEPEKELTQLAGKCPVLAKSLNRYYGDLGVDKLEIILLEKNNRNHLIAITSPFTGFVTPPDMDNLQPSVNGIHLRRPENNGKEYFSDKYIDFVDRSPLFKSYMFQLANDGEMPDSMNSLMQYIKGFDKDPDITFSKIPREPVTTDEGDNFVIGGLPISTSKGANSVNYFTKHLIKIPYEMSSENYFMPKEAKGNSRICRYLLPLTDEALTSLDLNNIELKVKESSTMVTYTLEFNGEKYEKTYNKAESSDDIVDLEGGYHSDVEIGLFPGILSYKDDENNYFKVMLVTRDNDESDRFKPSDIVLHFYSNRGGKVAKLKETESSAQYGVLPPHIRSQQGSDGNSCTTKFYEVFNAGAPAAIVLSFDIEGKHFEGALLPQLKRQKSVSGDFIYAVDLGTSYTYITRRDLTRESEPVPLKMSSPMMIPLHACGSGDEYSLIDRWEKMPFSEAANYFLSEFTPVFIDGGKYKFPLRTALLKAERVNEQPCLFDTHNIAFSYGRIPTAGDNSIVTQLKWNDGQTDEVRLFIRELLMVIRNDAMQNGCDLGRLKLRWTYPLSFDSNTKNEFDSIWKQEAETVIGLKPERIDTCSESMAPYYYFKAFDRLRSVKSAVVIDIGGGTTDYVYFADNRPMLASSIRLGCDALWGTGYSTPTDRSKNRLYNHLKGRIKLNDSTYSEINERMISKDSNVSTSDVINYWLSLQDKGLKVDNNTLSSVLRKEARHLFVYHLCTILYSISITLKKNGYEAPNEILFCGGGSRYIDNFIDNDTKLQGRLAKSVFDHVWDRKDTEIPHIILDEKRKEATGFGALYADDKQPPETKFFNEIKSDDVMTHVAEVERQLCDMHKLYINMLQLFDDAYDIDAIKNCLNDGIHDAVDKTLRLQVKDRAERTKNYNGTLMTIPALDRLIELTQTLQNK